MALAAPQTFVPPAIPWLQVQPLLGPEDLQLGPGLDPLLLHGGLQRLPALGSVLALVAFGSLARAEARGDSDLDLAVILAEPQLSPEQKALWWARCRKAVGCTGVGVDLVEVGRADAERLSGSRWHVLGDVARQGRVLYAAGGDVSR
jgi:predicted nucleotidyltransferase